jgi:biopolymer transport protein ExbD
VLKAIVAAHPNNREVRIVAEPTTRYEAIIEVMDISRAAGLPEAGLADASLEAS